MIEDFAQGTRDNIGGIRFFRFVPYSYVSDIPYPADKTVTGPITFNASYNWLLGYSPWDFSEYILELVPDSSGGDFYKFAFEGFLPRISHSSSLNLERMRPHRFILDIYDNNGNRKIIGSVENPVAFKFKEGSSKPGGRNGYAYSFFGELSEAFNYVDASFLP